MMFSEMSLALYAVSVTSALALVLVLGEYLSALVVVPCTRMWYCGFTMYVGYVQFPPAFLVVNVPSICFAFNQLEFTLPPKEEER